MPRGLYSVKILYQKNRKERFYLEKKIRYGDKRFSVLRYLCSGTHPSEQEMRYYQKKYGLELEQKAAKKIGQLSIGKFKLNYLNPDVISNLEGLKYLYRRFTELVTGAELAAYNDNFEIHYVHGTTSIEGNTLTLKQASDLLVHGIVPGSKSLREVNEVQNFVNVKRFRDSYKSKVNLEFIKSLHALIMHNIDNESAGYFRRADNIGIQGCDLQLCPSSEIPESLSRIIDYYYRRINEGYHPFEEAAMFHYFFEMIHPFTDGNGRVGREILNYMLLKNKYPKLLFLGGDRDRYISALKLGNDNNYSEMVSIFANVILEQNTNALLANLEKLVAIPPKRGQTRLTDFIPN
jgi:Fic family protein